MRMNLVISRQETISCGVVCLTIGRRILHSIIFASYLFTLYKLFQCKLNTENYFNGTDTRIHTISQCTMYVHITECAYKIYSPIVLN